MPSGCCFFGFFATTGFGFTASGIGIGTGRT
jgi:hypothetical protein